MTTLSLNNIANPTLVLSPSAIAAANFGIGIVITEATSIPVGGRVQSFASAAEVLAAFPSDTELNAFADVYFGQDFTPEALLVGVYNTTAETGDASITAAIAACQDANPSFYGVAGVSDISTANQILLEAWCESNKKRFFGCTQEADCLSPATPPTNMLYLASEAGYGRTGLIYSDAASDAGKNAHAAMMAFYLTTVYDQPNSIKTALMADFTGIGAATLTQTQFDRICGKTDGSSPGWNGNVYGKFGTANVLQRGLASDGRFIDEGCALDWLLANMQVDLINKMRSQRIPATDTGAQLLASAPIATLNKAVRNGLLAPGVWNFPGFGDLKTGDTVPNGYYIYAAPVTSLSDADRAARKAPAITYALVGAGALQYCNPTVIFQQ